MKFERPLLLRARRLRLLAISLVLLGAATGTLQSLRAQQVTHALKSERERGQEMLKTIQDDLKKYYYDGNFHGMNLAARFKTAQEKIKDAPTSGQVLSIIAQVLVELDDSHTVFLPPYRPLRVDYGWRMQMIGDICYVTAVKPDSDAAQKGLRPGDIIYSIDGYEPTRENLWKIKYSYYTLKPRAGMQVVVQEPNGQVREPIELIGKLTLFGMEISVEEVKGEKVKSGDKKEEKEAKEKKEKKAKEKKKPKTDFDMPRYYEASKDLIICKLPDFELDSDNVDKMMKRIAPYHSLILDLRGNPGGYVKALQRMVGYFFDHDLKIADQHGRKDIKPMMAKTRKENVFGGRLAVLVDGESASAAEIFARLIQLEKRGTVIGDRTSGKVMESQRYAHIYDPGVGNSIIIALFSMYGASITTADVIMSDGKSLEHTGVTPDELLLPTGADLAARRDPVLARAAKLLDVELDPKKAGALFPGPLETAVDAQDPESNDDEDNDN